MTEVYFKGVVEKIIFHNPDSMYYIASIEIKETDSDYTGDTIVVTGNMVDLQEDNSYVFKGEIVQNGKRGEQLKVSFYELDKLEGENLISYFASDQFKGIGPKKAMKIIEIYGDDPIDKILEDPSKLATISGLTQRVREAFVQTLKGDYQKAETPRDTRVLGVSVIAILKKSCDRLSTFQILKAPQCSSQHLKNAVISRVCEFYGCRNVGKRERYTFQVRR